MPLHKPALQPQLAEAFNAFTKCVEDPFRCTGYGSITLHSVADIASSFAHGGTLHPGRLYVNGYYQYVTSVDRLIQFTRRPGAQILRFLVERAAHSLLISITLKEPSTSRRSTEIMVITREQLHQICVDALASHRPDSPTTASPSRISASSLAFDCIRQAMSGRGRPFEDAQKTHQSHPWDRPGP